jgi:hypothetical protein
MSRRSGQDGTVVIAGNWYRVRWRIDAEGQEKRIYMSEKVAPVVSTETLSLSCHQQKWSIRPAKLSSSRVRIQSLGLAVLLQNLIRPDPQTLYLNMLPLSGLRHR